MIRRAFTFIELLVAVLLIGILAGAAIPTTKKLVKREKELQLRRNLLEMRQAIDRFKRMADEGEIEPGAVEQLGYPADFEQLINGVNLVKQPGQSMRFLRRIPKDPMTGETEWGMRSVQDDPDAQSWGGENLFDVYSLSDGTAMDGSEYSSW